MRVPLLGISVGKRSALERVGGASAAASGAAYAGDVVAPAERARLVAEALHELRSAPSRRRVRIASKAGLPQGCAALGADASPLLAYFLDDNDLRAQLAEPATRVWLAVDGAACAAHVLARADALKPNVVLLVLASAHVDDSEVYDVIAPRYRRDSEMRQTITRGFFAGTTGVRNVVSDVRFVDLALEGLALDPVTSCRLLGVNGTARAVEELRGIVDKANGVDEPMVNALAGLELALQHDAHIEVLVALLTSRVFAALSPREIADGPLGFKLGIYGYELQRHPTVVANARFGEIVERCMRDHPMPVVG